MASKQDLIDHFGWLIDFIASGDGDKTVDEVMAEFPKYVPTKEAAEALMEKLRHAEIIDKRGDTFKLRAKFQP